VAVVVVFVVVVVVVAAAAVVVLVVVVVTFFTYMVFVPRRKHPRASTAPTGMASLYFASTASASTATTRPLRPTELLYVAPVRHTWCGLLTVL
jgi:hypothetical protein